MIKKIFLATLYSLLLYGFILLYYNIDSNSGMIVIIANLLVLAQNIGMIFIVSNEDRA